MPTEKPLFCSRCGAPTRDLLVEARCRQVCTRCGMISYRNPLPVAAAVLLDDRDEVLLVRRAREPSQGMWCLPMGFAELGESIEEAALRELQEETGIAGRVLRLLDVGSYLSDFYGDLLIVSFEVARGGGVEQPGDDASDLAWFPLHALPELAFDSNEKVLGLVRSALAVSSGDPSL